MAYLRVDWMAVKKALEEADAPVTAKQIGLADQAIILTPATGAFVSNIAFHQS